MDTWNEEAELRECGCTVPIACPETEPTHFDCLFSRWLGTTTYGKKQIPVVSATSPGDRPEGPEMSGLGLWHKSHFTHTERTKDNC